jgi:ATP-dependent Lhr-like helicase
VLRALREPPVSFDLRHDMTGRWSAVPVAATELNGEVTIEMFARALLERYGVIFRRLLTRETNAPSWRELTRVYRRLEARGEIRGGRFVTGVSGEQFALPDAVEALRAARREPKRGEVVRLSACDPLNLVGIITPGPRVAAALPNTVVYEDGVPQLATAGTPAPESRPWSASGEPALT